MTKQPESRRARHVREQLLRDLIDPKKAALYLNAAAEDSDSLFLLALRDVAEARRIPAVAQQAGMHRQMLYRMLSETGNPTHASLRSLHHTFLLGAAGEQEENGPRAGRSSGAGVPDGMPTDTQSSAYRSKAGHAKSYGWAPESSGEDGGADRCAVDCVSLEPCRAAPRTCPRLPQAKSGRISSCSPAARRRTMA